MLSKEFAEGKRTSIPQALKLATGSKRVNLDTLNSHAKLKDNFHTNASDFAKGLDPESTILK